MGLSCRCQTLPKGSAGRPCEKCKAWNKLRNAKQQASGAHRKAEQTNKRSINGRQVQRRAELKYRRSVKGRQVQRKAYQEFKRMW